MNVPFPAVSNSNGATAAQGGESQATRPQDSSARKLFAELIAGGAERIADLNGSSAISGFLSREALFDIQPLDATQRSDERREPSDEADAAEASHADGDRADRTDDSGNLDEDGEQVAAAVAPAGAPLADFAKIGNGGNALPSQRGGQGEQATPASPTDGRNGQAPGDTDPIRPEMIRTDLLAPEAQRGTAGRNGLAGAQVSVTREAEQLTSRPGAFLTRSAGQTTGGGAGPSAFQLDGEALNAEAQQQAAAERHLARQGPYTPVTGQADSQAKAQNQPAGHSVIAAVPAATRPVQPTGQNGANLGNSGQNSPQPRAGDAASASGQSGNTTSAATGGAAPARFGDLTGAAMPQSARPPQGPQFTRFVHNQVAVQIKKAAGTGQDRISIQLKPQDLGRIDVKMDLSADGSVKAQILVDKADTLDLLQRDARGLERALADAGLKAESGGLEFSLRGDGSGQGTAAKHADSQGPAGAERADADPADGAAAEHEVALGVNLRADEGGMDMRI